MISQEWLNLETNRKYDIPTRIADSGRAWGDAQDPEEKEEATKRFREEKDAIVSKKKQKMSEKEKNQRTQKTKAKPQSHIMCTRSQQQPVASGSRAVIDPSLV